LISTGSDCSAEPNRFERACLGHRVVAPKDGRCAGEDGLGDRVELDPVHVVLMRDAESVVRVDGH